MLGSMVYRYFKHCYDCTVMGTSRTPQGDLVPFDVCKGFDNFPIKLEELNYVINCIGITKPYCHDNNPEEVKNAIYVNALFPRQLAELAAKKGFRVIQIATDCVFAGTRGNYLEDEPHDPPDVYGKTKSLGEVRSRAFLNIRCSIVGPEPYHKAFLMEWFFSQSRGATVKGYTNHFWSGVTTLQFAKLCKEIIFKNQFDALAEKSPVHHFVPNNTVSKYELLRLFNKVFDRGVNIEPHNAARSVNLTLGTQYNLISSFYPATTIERELVELKQFQQIGEFIHHTKCRFCQSSRMTRIMDFGNVPLAGGFLKSEQFADEKYYPLKVHFCEDCALVQVNNAIPPEVLFKNYFYFSSSIKTLVEHCATFAKEVYERFLKDRERPSVFEIGCNDGVMLKPFAALGVKAVGVDPATNVVNSVKQEGFIIINDFFGERIGAEVKKYHGFFDAVVSSYSFAHIDDMISVMKGIQYILKENGVLIFEVYYLGTMMEEMQYDMIYHEHLNYYSLHTLRIFLKSYGMEIFDVKYTPGVRSGAVRFYAQKTGARRAVTDAVRKMEQEEAEKGYNRVETFLDYGKKVETAKIQLLQLLNRFKKEGKTVIGYGASGRGTMIMNYCGIDGRYLDYVVDDAPAKHGFYTPGTHVEIAPWERTAQGKFPDYALLFAWSFMKEVLNKRQDHITKGGKFIVPLPRVTIVP